MTDLNSPSGMTEQTPYEQFGGHDFFAAFVHDFYLGVAEDEPLRALYPEADLGPAEDRLRMFLEQYWGGPSTYSELRGHPRLRARHVNYKIDIDQRDRWLNHMRSALDNRELSPELDQLMWTYLSRVADFLVNSE